MFQQSSGGHTGGKDLSQVGPQTRKKEVVDRGQKLRARRPRWKLDFGIKSRDRMTGQSWHHERTWGGGGSFLCRETTGTTRSNTRVALIIAPARRPQVLSAVDVSFRLHRNYNRDMPCARWQNGFNETSKFAPSSRSSWARTVGKRSVLRPSNLSNGRKFRRGFQPAGARCGVAEYSAGKAHLRNSMH